MSTYILHGGYYRRDTSDNKRFFKEIAKHLPDDSKMLFIPYAREKSNWQEKMDDLTRQISEIIKDKKINLILASDDKDTFIEQIKSFNSFFITGGMNNKLLYDYLVSVPNLKKLWKDKLVVGSSAGVQILSKYYCLWLEDRICEGLGILPIKTIVHWTDNQSDKLEKLSAYKENLELFKIPEEKYIVIN